MTCTPWVYVWIKISLIVFINFSDSKVLIKVWIIKIIIIKLHNLLTPNASGYPEPNCDQKKIRCSTAAIATLLTVMSKLGSCPPPIDESSPTNSANRIQNTGTQTSSIITTYDRISSNVYFSRAALNCCNHNLAPLLSSTGY